MARDSIHLAAARARTSARVAIACAAVLAGCAREAAPPEPVRAVRTLTVGADTVAPTHEFAAEVRARTEARLSFRVGGKLVERPADVGERVAAGQVLARLDARDLQLGQDAARAALRAASTTAQQAGADYQRFAELHAQGFISAAELERRRSTRDAALAQADQAQAQAAVQANQAGYSALVAGTAGVVTAVEAEPGAVLGAGQGVVRLALDGPRDAVFAVPEDGVAGLRALVGRPGVLGFRSWNAAQEWPIVVREVAAAADPVTRTFLVKADAGAAPLSLGQSGTVVMRLPTAAGVARVPLPAVAQWQGRTSVWLLDAANMTVQPVPVQVAAADGNLAVVSQGLKAGQEIVVAGVHTLTPGQKVKRWQAPARTSVAEAR
jgi:RND family efflux transporter MFP subunit